MSLQVVIILPIVLSVFYVVKSRYSFLFVYGILYYN